MERKMFFVIINRKHICFAAVLVLLSLAVGERAYSYPMKVHNINASGGQLTAQDKIERYQNVWHWVHSTKPEYVFVPLRKTSIKRLDGERGVMKKYGGFVKETKDSETVYYVAYSKDKYREYFLKRRWKNLSPDKQSELWKIRMSKNEEIKRRLETWLLEESKRLPEIRTPLPESYSDLQGSYYMENFQWLILVDLKGLNRTASIEFYYKDKSHRRGYSYGGSCTASFEEQQSFHDGGNWVKRDVLCGQMIWRKWKNDDPSPLTPRNPATPRPPQPPYSFVRLFVSGYSNTSPRVPIVAFRIMRPPWVSNALYGPVSGESGRNVATWRGAHNRKSQDLPASYANEMWWPKVGLGN
jgi:hypothetical protein